MPSSSSDEAGWRYFSGSGAPWCSGLVRRAPNLKRRSPLAVGMVNHSGPGRFGSVHVTAELFAWGRTISRPCRTRTRSTRTVAAMIPAISFACVPPATKTVAPGSEPWRTYTSLSPGVFASDGR